MFKQLTTILLKQPQVREQWEKMTDYDRVNVSDNERVTSLVFGGTTLLGGLSRPFSLRGLLGLTGGGFLLYRGLRGFCPLYNLVGYNSMNSEAQREIEREIGQHDRYASGANGASVDEQMRESFPASDAPANY